MLHYHWNNTSVKVGMRIWTTRAHHRGNITNFGFPYMEDYSNNGIVEHLFWLLSRHAEAQPGTQVQWTRVFPPTIHPRQFGIGPPSTVCMASQTDVIDFPSLRLPSISKLSSGSLTKTSSFRRLTSTTTLPTSSVIPSSSLLSTPPTQGILTTPPPRHDDHSSTGFESSPAIPSPGRTGHTIFATSTTTPIGPTPVAGQTSTHSPPVLAPMTTRILETQSTTTSSLLFTTSSVLSSSSPIQTSDGSSASRPHLSGGAIAGIAVVLVVSALCVVSASYFKRRRRRVNLTARTDVSPGEHSLPSLLVLPVRETMVLYCTR